LGFTPARNGHVFAVRFDERRDRWERLWSRELEGHVEWSHPAIGPDGALYLASSAGSGTSGSTYFGVHAPGTVPAGSTPRFYAFRGPPAP
ncbi:MAG TPA: hypothetical protein VFR37_16370, partial [Longimicrobium sp.]|nr:hypothetical protein [Longimicrobium sp.]